MKRIHWAGSKSATVGSLLAVAILVVALVAPLRTAYAAPLSQDYTRLENLLKREQIVLANQQERLNWANQIVSKTQVWITALKNQGKDTTALEAALAAYQTGVGSAQSSWSTAKNVLDAHAGFDANGQVVDRSLAVKTLVDAGKAERQCHLTITQATINFRNAVAEYRKSK